MLTQGKERPKAGIATAGSLYAVTTTVQRILGIILLPFFTRWLAPDEYGQIAFLASLAGLAGYVFPLGLEAVILRGWFKCQGDDERVKFTRSMQGLLLLIPPALVLPACGLLMVVRATPNISFVALFATLASSAIFVAATVVPYGVLRAQKMTGRYVLLGLGYTLAGVGGRLVFVGAAGMGVAGWLLADALAAALLLATAPRLAHVSLSLSVPSRESRAALRVGLPLVPHGLGHWGLALADRMILIHAVPLAAIGIYSIGYQASSVLIALFTEFNRAIGPEYASRSTNCEVRDPWMKKLVAAQAGTVVAVGLAAALAGPVAIRAILPETYSHAADVIPWVTLGSVFLGLYHIPMNHLTLVRGETRRIWIATVTAMAVNIAANLLTVWRFGIMAAAVNTALAYAVLLLLVRRLEARRTGMVLKPDLRVLREYGGLVGTTLILFGLLVPRYTGFPKLAIATGLAGMLAVLAVALFGRVERSRTPLEEIPSDLVAAA